MQKALRSLVMLGLAAIVAVTPIAPARAQMAVIDPTNLAQNLLQAARALEQINNQIRQIEQATQMLRQNPLQLSPELTQSISEARELFDSAQGIAFEVNQVGENLRTLYPETWEDFDLEGVLQQSERWEHESRDSLQRAMEAEARAARSIEGSRNRIDRALQSSSSAEGQTGAIQASNQLLGVTASQRRALETERMERLAREERAREIQRRAFPTETTRSTEPARTAF